MPIRGTDRKAIVTLRLNSLAPPIRPSGSRIQLLAPDQLNSTSRLGKPSNLTPTNLSINLSQKLLCNLVFLLFKTLPRRSRRPIDLCGTFRWTFPGRSQTSTVVTFLFIVALR